jgi:hypothetical protein
LLFDICLLPCFRKNHIRFRAFFGGQVTIAITSFKTILGLNADRIRSPDRHPIIPLAGHNPDARTLHPIRGGVLELAYKIENPIAVHVLYRALVLVVALNPDGEAIERERIRINGRDVKRGAPENRYRNYTVAIDVETVRVAARLDVDAYVLATREYTNPIARL